MKRIRSLFYLTMLCLGMVPSSMAGPTPSYSVQIQTNWNAITYQWSGVKRVTTDLGLPVQNGDAMMVFELASQTFSNYTYTTKNGWSPSEPTLSPGQGAFFYSQSVATWTVSGAANTPTLPLNLPVGVYCLVGCQTNMPATFDDIAGYAAPSGAELYRLIPGSAADAVSCPNCFMAYSNVGGVWEPATPVANVGESVYLYLPASPPGIAQEPQAQTVPCGGTAAFSVVATGSPTLNYQWLSNNSPLPSATNSQFIISNAIPSDAASYSVIVFNNYGSTNSLAVTLTVTDTNPVSIVCPADMIVPAQGASGAVVNFAIQAQSACATPIVTATPPSGSMFPIGQTLVTATATDGGAQSNSCYFYVNVINTPDLSISITAPSQQWVLSNTITLSVTVSNLGPGVASNVVATAFLPVGINYVSAFSTAGSVTESNEIVTCQIGGMNSGASVTVTITGLVTEGNVDVLTSAMVTSANADTNLDNNAASIYTPLLESPENLQPFWFTSTILSNGYLILTLAGPSNQICAIDNSSDLLDWSQAFNATLNSNGLSTITIPLSSLPGGHYYRAVYLVTLTAPVITAAPSNLLADAGDGVSFAVQAGGSAPLSYQWYFNNAALAGQTGGELDLSDVSTNNAGTYAVVVSNAVGTVAASATLSVAQWNYGIAPDPPYPTLLASGGARHRVEPGFCLGSLEDNGVDAMPEPENFLYLFPLPPGNDGVVLPAVFVPGQPAQIVVMASAPGRLDAWIDYNGDGHWGDTNDQICASAPMSQGSNILTLHVPPTAVAGQTWSRFRFSSAGGLSYDGDAADGEVEDYPLTISSTPALGLTVTANPNPVGVPGLLNYVLTVTDSGVVPGQGVVVNDVYSAGATLVSFSASQGVVTTNNGVVTIYLGTLTPNASATIYITVSPTTSGTLTNTASVTAGSNAFPSVVTTTIALTPPSILNAPSNLALNVGDSGALTVTAGGSTPLSYQWFQNGAAIPLGTDATLPLFAVTTSNAGSYWVQVTNAVGSATSAAAVVSVQQEYLASSQAEPGGALNPAGDTIVTAGASLTFVAIPDAGYTVDSWYLDGVQVLTNQMQFTLTNIQANHSVAVTFDNSTNFSVIPLTGNWSYNTNGVDLGTNWSQPGYDFTSWSNGPSLFAASNFASLYPVPLGTALQVGSQITYYFLTQFFWYGGTSNVTLTATNYINSGAAFYINGVLVGQVRLTNAPPSYDSTALPQNNPGQPDILTFPSTSLVTGVNVLAVEVHQTGPASPDVAFAMNLNAEQPRKSTVNIAPTELTILVGQTVKLTATGLPLPKVGNYAWSTNVTGIAAAQQGQITLTSTDTTNNSTASITGVAPGVVNVQVQYTGGAEAASDPVTCVVNVIQAQATIGSAGGAFNASGSAPLFNPSPIVVLDMPPDPGAGLNPQVTITGTVTSFIAPIAADHIFINGLPAASANVTSTGANGLGPFVQTFASQPIYIGDDDFAIVAAAVNALNNIGYGSMNYFVNRSTVDGSIASRSLATNVSVPALPANLAAYIGPYQGQVMVTDPKAAASGNTVTASINTGLDMKTVTLTKMAGTLNFTSPPLYYVPPNLALPAGTSAKITGARIKAQFGQFVTVTYQPAGGGPAATIQLVPTGVLIVQNGAPVNFIQSGVAADVTAASGDIPFTIQAGIDSRAGGVNSSVTVTSQDKFLNNLALPAPNSLFAPVQLAANVVKMQQANTNPASPQYNLYTNSCPPIMAIRRRMPVDTNGVQQPNAKITPLTVTYRGYVTAALASGATSVEPVSGIGYLLANPSSATSTNLNPPMVESDFLPEFNPNPVVLLTAPANQVAQAAPIPATIALQGQIINFINPTAKANLTVNGMPVTGFTADANSPQYGPWRATFTHNFPIDPQMPYQKAVVAVWDYLNDLGAGWVPFLMAGGGTDANGNPIAVTSMTPTLISYLTASSNVVTLVNQTNAVSLAGAMAVMRNNQFRIEANPILRGNLPWMFNNNSLTAQRQTDGRGTVDATSLMNYYFDVTPIPQPYGGGLVRGGGGAATARLVLIPQLATADNVVPPAPGGTPQVLSFRANAGVFVQASLTGQMAVRPALASPNGAYIMRSTAMAQVDTVVPGTYRDIGGNPADISVLFRVGASGLNLATGAGQPTLAATCTSAPSAFGPAITQPTTYQLLSLDTGMAVGAAADRQQFVNFPAIMQNLTLSRASLDTTSPLFNMYQWQKPAPAVGEESMTIISTGTYPAAGPVAAMQVSTATAGVGLQYAYPGSWVQLQCATVATPAVKPVFGADFEIMGPLFAGPGAFGNGSTQTDNNGIEIPNNFTTRADFCVQLQERPISAINVNPGPPTAAPMQNFWLRVERPTVNPGMDLVLPGETGRQVVAYVDTDPAPGFQAGATVPSAGFYRYPPAAASYQTILGIGTATAMEAPNVGVDVGAGVSQIKFEGINLPNVAISVNNPAAPGGPRRALPPQRYWFRPVMLAPTGGGRYVLGRDSSYTVPYVINAQARNTYNDLNATYGLIAAAPAAPGGAGMTAAQQTAMVNAFFAQWCRVARRAYGTGTTTANRDFYVANAPNIRFVHPSAPQPQIPDFVVPCKVGGNRGPGSFGAAATVNVLKSQTDEVALTPPANGVFVGAFFNAFGVQGNSPFVPFRGANPPYGGAAGDNFVNLQNALNNDILSMAGPINLPPLPAGMVAASRDDLAMNAATLISRCFGRVLVHEVGHTCGLLSLRTEVNDYFTAFFPGTPTQPKADSFHVGSDWSFKGAAAGQYSHEGQIYRSKRELPGGGIGPFPPPPVGTTQAAGVVATYAQAVTANAAGVAIPVSDCDDLMLMPLTGQNFIMDSGSFQNMSERSENADSQVTFNPAVPAGQVEPVGSFTARDLLELRAVLPRN